MPTYAALMAEAVWRAQFVPPLLDSVLIRPLRTFYSLGPSAVGAPGDNNHVYGRHRSANWDRTSIYCTNRSYGTTDARDKRGGQDWYRAVDIGISGQPLWDACHRLDNAVRAGRLPGLAEWFGSYDGKTVVGWYEGHPSSSDSSHLYHAHVGLWNEVANDEATLRAVYQTFTGQVPTTEVDDMPSILLTNAQRLYLANGFDLKGIMTEADLNALRTAFPGPDRIVSQADVDKGLFGTVHGDTPPVIITPEQLAAIAAAAKAGAEAGAPTHEELVAAAEEGANKAEDS